MIAFLRGLLFEKTGESVVVDVGGVGYAVTVTAGALRALPAVGAEVRLFIYTHAVQDGPMQLYGFAEADERRVFETLLSVQGIGPKVGVAIVSGLPVGELAKAIASGDVARLTQIRGVGRKIAERLAVELRDKIGVIAAGVGVKPTIGGFPVPIVPAGRLGEVYAALVALGYRPPEFEGILGKLDAELPVADLVKQGLAALRRK